MKVFRNLRSRMLKEGKIKRYLLYAIGEVLLVMIGILLALQVNDWNDDKLRRSEEINYYKNVHEELIADSTNIFSNRLYNRHYLDQFTTAIDIIEKNDRTQIDSLGKIIFNLTEYSDFDRQGNIYETLVTGGEIKLLRNQEIINAIQVLEGRYIYMNRMENIHWDVIMQDVLPSISESLKFVTAEIQKPEKVYSYQFQNLITGLLLVMDEKETIYIETNERIKALLKLIDQELAKDQEN